MLAGIVSGLVGLGMGYLTLRLRGAFFAIATLALAVVLQTIIVNWTFVGGARGAYVIRPATIAYVGNYIHYLFLDHAGSGRLRTDSGARHRTIVARRTALQRSATTNCAAEASGVPTLKLKLIATTLSGAFMGMAGRRSPLSRPMCSRAPCSAWNMR